MCIALLVKYPLFLSDFSDTEFFRQFSRNTEITNFMEMRTLGAELFHAYGRTNRHDEANSRLLQFCELSKNLFVEEPGCRSMCRVDLTTARI